MHQFSNQLLRNHSRVRLFLRHRNYLYSRISDKSVRFYGNMVSPKETTVSFPLFRSHDRSSRGRSFGRVGLCLGCCVFGALLLALSPVQAQTLLRGPYLQNATTNSMVIRWRTTSEDLEGVVRYGPLPNLLNQAVTSDVIRIHGQAADNPSTFTTNVNSISSRSLTTNSVSWMPPIWTTSQASGADQQTPNLSSIVQEVVDRAGWSSGNSMAFILSGSGERVAESGDKNSDPDPPELHIVYNTGGSDLTNVVTLAEDSADDAEESTSTGAVNCFSTDLEITREETFNRLSQIVGLRFNSVSVPSGANVVNAFIQFTVDEVDDDISRFEVEIAGLEPWTKYYYSIGTPTNVLAGGDTNHYFYTLPPRGMDKTTRFWVLGDSGRGGVSHSAGQGARDVRDAFYDFHGSDHPDFWIMLGDNAYRNGTDEEYQDGLFDMYPNTLRNSVLWLVLGNHEFDAGTQTDSVLQSGTYYDLFTMPKAGEAGGVASGSEAYFSFDYANMHFICLESITGVGAGAPEQAFQSDMEAWLSSDLAATTQDWVIALWHHPPYSKGSHDTDDALNEDESFLFRTNMVPILEQAGVDLVLTGHSHDYERSMFIHGHYETSDQFNTNLVSNGGHVLDGGNGRLGGDGAYQKVNTPTGTVYTVAGSSSRTTGSNTNFSFGLIGPGGVTNPPHPVKLFSFWELGSVVIDVSRDCLDAYFIDDTVTGPTTNLMDFFRISKGSNCNQDPRALDDAATANRGGTLNVVASGLLANDVDPDTGTNTLLTVSTNPVVQPMFGTLTLSTNGSYTYVNNGNSAALDYFVYEVTDDTDGVGKGTVVLTIDPGVDLGISKTVDNTTPAESDLITYTLIATNSGLDNATGVQINDDLPTGVTFSSASSSDYVSGTGIWTIGALSSGASTTLTVSATVDAGTSGSTITNVASVSAVAEVDVNVNNDSDSALFTVQQADLSLSKSVDNVSPNVGQTVVFTVWLTNDGPHTATGVEVTDLIPTNLTSVVLGVSQGGVTGNVWTVGAVADTGVATLSITGVVAGAGIFTNVAEVTASDQGDPDSTPNNQQGGEDDQDSAVVSPPQADLSLTKVASDATPNVGQAIVFTVSITNDGPDSATGIEVTDVIPSSLTGVGLGMTQGGVTGSVWTVGALANAAGASLSITGVVDTAGVFTNIAEITAVDQADPDSTPNNQQGGEDDQDDAMVTPQEADLSLIKTVSNGAPNVGETIVFTVSLTNDGPHIATGIDITDLIPANLSSVALGVTQGGVTGSVWSVGALANNTGASLSITGVVNSTGSFTNLAEVTAVNEFDPDSTPNNQQGGEDDQDRAVVTPLQADLTLNKAVDDPTPTVGQSVVFTVTLTNHGPDTATGIAVTDVVPTNLTGVAFGVTQGGVTGSVWTVGVLSSATSASLSITGLVNSAGTFTNTAEVTASDVFDPDSTPNNQQPGEDDQDRVTVSPNQADLSLNKIVSDAQPNVGQTLVFTVSVTNDGPDTATGIAVTDVVPTNLTGVALGVTQGGVTGNIWTVGTLANASGARLSITGTVDSAGAFTNVAEVTAVDQSDPDSAPNNQQSAEDDQDNAVVTPQQADLSVIKAVDRATPDVGQTIVFTVSVTNDGPNAATGIELIDIAPTNLTGVALGVTQGGVTGDVWSVGTLGVASGASLSMTGVVSSAGMFTNVAELTAVEQFDPDSAPNNQQGAEDDQADAVVTPLQADLSVAKVVNNNSPNVGDTIVFTISVTNHGPSVATGITITDMVPTNLTGVAMGVTQGGITGSVWTVGTLTNAADAYLSITGVVNNASGFTNVAEVTASDRFDPDSTPNNQQTGEDDQGEVLVTPQQSDLSLNKIVNNPNPQAGETIVFTVSIVNNGPNTATGVEVTDPIPANLTGVGLGVTQGGVTGSIWAVGSLANASSASLSITGVVNSAASFTNTAEVTFADQFDPDSTPNNQQPGEDDQADAVVEPLLADLSLLKTVDNASPTVGQTIVFTVALTNDGPNAATGISVTDLIPTHLSSVTTGTTQGGVTGNVWTVGTLANGAGASLSITGVVNSAGSFTNTAEVTAVDQFDPDSTPNNQQSSEDDQASAVVGAQQADLALGKAIDDSTPNVGQTIVFTVSVTNEGPDTATGIEVTDVVPTNVTSVTLGVTQGGVTGSVWTVGSLADTQAATLVITGVVNSVGGFTNVAEITASDLFDPDSTPDNQQGGEDDQGEVVVSPQQADLSLTKIVDNTNPNAGETIVFTVSVTNAGPSSASGIAVTDVVPTNLTSVALGVTQGSLTGDVWSVGGLASGTSAMLSITGVVNTAASFTNLAEITSAEPFDPDSTPNNQQNGEDDQDESIVVPRLADLSLNKTVDDAGPNVGQTIVFTVSITNDGPDTATGIHVTDVVPVNLTGVALGLTQGSVTGSIWTVGSLANGASASLSITGVVDSAAAFTNTAEVTAMDPFDPDSTANNQVEAEDDQVSVVVTPLQADLALSKVADVASPNVGETIVFTISVTNNGPDTATGVQLTDVVPTNLTSVGLGVTQGGVTGSIWTVGSIADTGVATLSITGVVNSAGAFTNTVEVTSVEQIDPDSTPNNQVEAEDDQDSVVVTPLQADLALTKVVDDPTPNVGQGIVFTILVTNSGPDTATGIAVTDLLPTNVTSVAVGFSQGGATGSVWTVGMLANGEAATASVTGIVSSTTGFTNVAEVTAVDQFDPDSVPNNQVAGEDDQDDAIVVPLEADLSLNKVVDNATPNVGETVVFMVSVTNDGPDTATGVHVTDLIPTNLAGVVLGVTQGGVTGSVWTVGTLASGAMASLSVTGVVDSVGAFTNVAEITSADQSDPDSTPNNQQGAEDDQDDETVIPQQADLSLSKTVNNASPVAGERIVFTVSITNDGPDSATAVELTDVIPANLSSVSLGVSQGGFTGSVWTVGNLASTEGATLSITGIVNNAAIFTNVAEITAVDQFDPDSTPNNQQGGEDDQDEVAVTPLVADVSLGTAVDNPSPNMGETIVFTVSVTNDGPNTATGLNVTDVVPAALTDVGLGVSQGGVTGSVWTVGTLAGAQVATLSVTGVVSSSAVFTNVAEVTSLDPFDPDSTPNNQVGSEDDQDEVTVTPQQADLSLNKTVDHGSPTVGQTIVFTVSVTNAGPNTATGVDVTDTVPTNLVNVTTGVSQGGVTGDVWTVGSLANGAGASLSITGVVNSAGNFTNTAEITASDQFDPDSTPNNRQSTEDDQDTVLVGAEQADLSLNKTVDDATPNVGQTIVFTVSVTNEGPDTATDVQITDALPTHLANAALGVSQGGVTNEVWTVGSLANGQVATLSITGLVNSADSFTNVAEITAAGLFDPDSTPNNQQSGEDDQSEAVVTPQQADLSLGKSVDDGNPNVGQTIAFTVSITNDGPSVATGVTVTDIVPTNLTGVGLGVSQGSVTGDVWIVGTLASAAGANLSITGIVSSAESFTNTAEVTAVDQFDPDSGPNNQQAGEDDQDEVSVTPQQADLTLSKSVDDTLPNVGQTIVFTVSITNQGPDAATSVQVTDVVPAGLSGVTLGVSQGGVTGSVWTVGAIADTGVATLSITGLVSNANVLTNVAEITAADQFDPDSTPNNQILAEDDQDQVVVTPLQADLSLDKAVDDASPTVGQTVVFTISVTNAGPNAATGVNITDVVPTNLTSVARGVTQGGVTGDVWTVGSLSSLTGASLSITGVVGSAGTFTNTAEVTAVDQFDPDSTPNNQLLAEDDQDRVIVGPEQADLSLSKTVDDANPNVGETIVFTISVTNDGPNAATGVNITDVVPTNLTSVARGASQGGVTGDVWTVGSLASTQVAILSITGVVEHADAFTNRAEITSSDLFDPDSTPNNQQSGEDDQDSAVVTPQQADLSLAKSVDDPTPNVGQTIVFTVSVTNDGPNAATGLSVTDVIPTNVTDVGTGVTQGGITGSIWSVGTLGNGAGASLSITGVVNSAGSFTNIAEIISVDPFDPDSVPNNQQSGEDDQDSSVVTPQQADLSLAKSVDDSTPNVGQTIAFTVSVTNDGPNAATGLSVTDVIPTNVTDVGTGVTQGGITGSIWSVGTLGNGAGASLSVTGVVNSAGSFTNIAEIISVDQFDSDSVPNNQQSHEDDWDEVVVTPQQADLSLSKTVDDATPNVGQTIVFTVSVTNDGPHAATSLNITDVIPTHLTGVGLGVTQGGVIGSVWSVGTLSNNAGASLSVTGVVNSANSFTNVAEVTGVAQFDPDSVPNNQQSGEDDQDAAVVTPLQADLSLSKTVDDVSPTVGQTIVFTVSITNDGPNSATGIEVTDIVPTNVTSVTVGVSQGGVTGSVWTVGTLLNATGARLSITGLVDSAGSFTNTAEVTAVDQLDPDSVPNNQQGGEDDQDSALVGAQQADLSLAKSVDNTNPNVGETVVFTVSITNEGPNTATGIAVTDFIPTNLTGVAVGVSQGGVTGSVWSVGSLANAQVATLSITGIVGSVAAFTNTAEVTSTDLFDPDSTPNNQAGGEDDQDEAVVTPQQADLNLNKSVDDATPNVGQTIVFTVAVTNDGPNAASGVSVTDLLPTNLTAVAMGVSQGGVTGDVWTIGILTNAQGATLSITGVVASANSFTNTAEVTASDQFDPDSTPNNQLGSEDDQDGRIVTPQQADLKLSHTVDDATPNVGQTIVFTVAVTNDGPNAATGVHVTDAVPSSLTGVATGVSQGGVTGDVWTIGILTNAQGATFSITGVVASAGSFTNTAEVTASDQFDPDSTPNNQAGGEDDQDEAVVTPQQADLNLSKSVDDATPNVGQTIVFTVAVTNDGPNAATGVSVTDVVPTNLIGVTTGVSQGGMAGSVWTVGTLTNAQVATLSVTGIVAGAGSFTNVAEVTASDQFDPDSAPNNQASVEDDQDEVVVLPLEADLSLGKMVDVTHPSVGQTIVFTVALTNSGPDTATGIDVIDQMPTNLTGVTTGVSQGGVTGSVWSVGALASAQVATLTITGVVSSAGSFTNVAEVTASDQFDPDSAPNNQVEGEDDQDEALVDPIRADLEITKTVDQAAPNVGETIVFTVVVTNAGPNTATGIEVTDVVPTNLNSVTTGVTQGSVSGSVWSVGTLLNTETATLSITGVVNSTSVFTNIAEVTASDQADPDSTPDNNQVSEDDQDSAIVGPEQADLSLTKTVNEVAPNVGETVVFTVVVTNAGPDTATGVEITDLVPTNLVGMSLGVSQGGITGSVWSVGSLTHLQTASLSITGVVGYAGSFTNIAEITASDQADPDSTPNNQTDGEDDQDDAVVTPQQADLSLGKAVDIPAPNVGQTIVFTVSVTNAGPNIATGVRITDSIPTNLTAVTSGVSQGGVTGSVWTVGSLGSAQVATLSVTAVVSAASGFTNVAEITAADQVDPDSTPNNQAGGEDDQDDAVVTPQQADLSLGKAVNIPTPNVGQTIVFTVSVTNAGPDSATSVTITDLVPTHLIGVSAGVSQGSVTGSVWNVGALANAQVATWSITGVVDSASSFTNTAEVTSVDQFDPDSTPNNQQGSEDDHDSVAVIPLRVDIAMSKSVDNSMPEESDTILYTVVATNHGPDAASGVVVTDLLPIGVTFVSADTLDYNATNGVWSIGGMNAGASTGLTLQATVDMGTSGVVVTNIASLTSVDQADTVGGNNSAQTLISVVADEADVGISKSVDNAAPVETENLMYTLVATNSGPADATGFEVTDLLPGGLSFNSASSGDYNSSNGVWTIGTLTSGMSTTLTLHVTVDAGSGGLSLTNRVDISALTQTDNNSTNDAASVVISVLSPVIGEVGSQTVDQPTAGTWYTVTYSQPLSNPVVVMEPLTHDDGPPAHTRIRNVTSSGFEFKIEEWDYLNGTHGVETVSWLAMEVGQHTLAPGVLVVVGQDTLDGEYKTVHFGHTFTGSPALFAATQTYNESDAGVVHIDTTFIDKFTCRFSEQESNEASNGRTPHASETLGFIAVQVGTGSIGTQVYEAGRTAQTVTHALSTINFTQVFSQVPEFIAQKDTERGSDPSSLRRTALSSTSATLFVEEEQSADSETSHAKGEAVGYLAIAPAGPIRLIEEALADLRVEKSDSADPIQAGGVLTYTINVHNDGPDQAQNVVLTEELPPGVTFVSSSGCPEDPNGVPICSLGTLAVSNMATITLAVQVDGVSNGTLTNRVSLSSSTTDPNTINDVVEETTVVVPPPVPDLQLLKDDGGVTVSAGGTVVYSLSYGNVGAALAAGVVITDTVPVNTTFDPLSSTVGWSCVPGAGAPGSVCTFSLGSLNAGSTGVVSFALTADPAWASGVDVITNTAQIGDDASGGADPTPANNASTDTTPIDAAPDLQVTKADGGASVFPGDLIVYTLAFTNAGTQHATGAVLTDTVPEHTAFEAASSTAGWVCTPNTNSGSICTFSVGDLAVGAGGSLVFAVRVDDPLVGAESVTNIVSIADDGSNGSDENIVNNSATETTPVTNPGTIVVTKDADPADGTDFDFNAGALGTFTLDDAVPDDADAVPNTIIFSGVNPGSYVITESIPTGSVFNLADLLIVENGAQNSTKDLPNDEVTVHLEGGETVTVTFSNSDDLPFTCIGYVGSVTVDQPTIGTVHTVTLPASLVDPVVIMEPMTDDDGAPAHVRILDVRPDAFDYKIEEWDYLNGTHGTETVSYLVMDQGMYTLDNGTLIEVGTSTIDENYKNITYTTTFNAAPIVLAETQTVNDPAACIVHIDGTFLDRFNVRLTEQEGNENGSGLTPHSDETLGYIAIEPSTGTIGIQEYQAGLTAKVVTHLSHTINFGATFGQVPQFIAQKNTERGSDPSSLRRTALTTTSATVHVEEEKSADNETSHAKEERE